MTALLPLPPETAHNFSWLSEPTIKVLHQAIKRAGGQARFIGGVVRDSLLGNPPEEAADFDLATTFEPAEMMAALEAADIKAVPTGIEHGTVTAIIGNRIFELTSLRADIETDGRHAQVAFTTHWQEDWRRRDFTINAIYLTFEGMLWDPAGGLADLAARKVRFIGDADSRLKEDYLRILRFYRFSAHFATGLDEAGRAACQRQKAGLEQIAAERKQAELRKLLLSPQAPETVRAMMADGVMPFMLPGKIDLAQFARLYKATVPTFETALAVLWPAGGAEMAKALRLSRKSADQIRATEKAAEALGTPDNACAREILYRFGPDIFRQALQLQMARNAIDVDAYHALHQLPEQWQAPDFPIKGAMLIDRGLKPGPALGAALKKAERLWIAAGYPVDEDALSSLLNAVLEGS